MEGIAPAVESPLGNDSKTIFTLLNLTVCKATLEGSGIRTTSTSSDAHLMPGVGLVAFGG
jgi:hypothetical protein